MKKVLIILLICLPLFVSSQIIEDFSDGEINSNPTWNGDVVGYEILNPPTSNNGAINNDAGNDAFVLRSLEGKDAVITTASNIAYGEWLFSVADGRGWSVSGPNDYKIILMSDQTNIELLKDGALDFNGYFIRFDGGESDQFILYKQTGTDSKILIDTNYPVDTDGSTPLGRTIKITRSITGDWNIYIDEGFEITPTTQFANTVNDNTHTTTSCFGIATDIANSSVARVLLFDNLQITPLATNDETSIVATGADLEPSTISSIINSADGLQVFDVTFSDPASGDALPTIIDNISFTQGDNNQINDWTNTIAGAKLFGNDLTVGLEGVINSTGISFVSDDFININDGENESYQLYIWLNTDLQNINDNENIEIKLDYSNIVCDFSGSSFGSGNAESGDNNLSIDIEASKINFTYQPNYVAINKKFPLSISATDINNNIDTDANNLITLSLATGTGSFTSVAGLSQNLISGIYTWQDLMYNQEGYFTIQVTSNGLENITSEIIKSYLYIYYLDEDFENGNLDGWQATYINRWQASEEEPINENFSLKQIYDNENNDIDIIAHKLENVAINNDTLIWRFQIKYINSAPSGMNNWNIYLFSNKDENYMTGNENINAYVVGVNFANDQADLIKLWSVAGEETTEIITTNIDWNNIDANTPKGIEVSRTNEGVWEIKIDDSGGGFDELESIGISEEPHTEHTEANYFGIYYEYTKNYDRQLWIDDIYFGTKIPDFDKPMIDTIFVVSSTKLQIYFNEEIDETTSEDINNYTVNEFVGNPDVAIRNADNYSLVELDFSTEFQDNTDYLLTVENVRDANNNVIVTADYEFVWNNLELLNVNIVSSSELDLYFSKKVEQNTAETASNYVVNNAIGNAISANIEESDSTIMHISFGTDFLIEEQYILTISNIEDNLGNIIETSTFSFMYYQVQQFDVIINELMIDVSPLPVALPPEKYIEIYNKSEYEIDLTNWTIEIGTNSTETFPAINIQPEQYIILCDEDAGSSFTAYAEVIAILNSSQITSTSGKSITIKNNLGQIIESITYSSDWYYDEDKDNGGWALERIDPTNVCYQDNNWQASLNYIGGTPGSQNSVFYNNPDNESPVIEDFELVSSKQIIIDFNENIDTTDGLNGINYLLNNSVTPLLLSLDPDDKSKVSIKFVDNFNFAENILTITNISDNCNNTINDTTFNFIYQLINATAVEPKSENQLKLYFTEKIETTTAEDPLNYQVDNSIGSPTNATIDSNDSSIVHLQFPVNFSENQNNTITVSNIKDINENTSESKQLDFTYHQAQAFDIVFNELMVDVNPEPVGLPEYQYIELYNTSDYDIWLSDWKFIAEDQSERIFPAVSIPSKEYLIISKENEDMSDKGLNINILGSSDLTQSGKELLLKTDADKLINYVDYSDLWYDDENKDNGGWSLEKIDPLNFCGTKSNWIVSVDISGGTPGTQNSTFAENPNEIIPEVKQIKVISSNHLLVEFTKNVSIFTSLDTINYIVNNGINYPKVISLTDTSYSTVHLYFEKHFSAEQSNTITISNINDDCDNTVEETILYFTYHLIYPETIWVLNSNQLQIQFSEEVLASTVLETDNYFVNNSIHIPNQAIKDGQNTNTIYLQFDNEFTDGQTYMLSISNIKDINNNTMINAELEFTYYISKVNDIVINELLFNPFSGGADFVELYNRSQYPINMIDMRIAKRNAESNEIENIYKINDHNYILNSESYLVLSIDTLAVQTDYYTEGNFIEMSSMPSYPDGDGTVIILNEKDSIMDEFNYSDEMHYALISNDDGVSLERIDYNMPINDVANWHSAAQNVGYATPGYQNSQYKDMSNIVQVSEITLSPEEFSPDNDGYNDVLNIFYEFEEGGYIANVLIYNKNGMLVEKLTNNELLAVSGFWTWDGLDYNSQKARIGIYAVVVEIFDLNGTVKTYKLACVLAGKN